MVADMNIIERFLAKTRQCDNGCIEWTASTDLKGYGCFRSMPGQYRAPRVSYILFKGEIPEGLSVLHSCDNPACVNPDHLRVGTPAENSADMVHRGHSTRGSKQPNAKLDEDSALRIFRDLRRYKEIAEEYDVSVSTVCAIKKGARWGYVTGTVSRWSS